MADLVAKLHNAQLTIFKSPARFKVVAAGRRFGKTHLAAWMLLTEALKSSSKDVCYVAPTYEMARKILWNDLKEICKPVTTSAHENTTVLTLVNGRRIHLKGSDKPDTLRGVGYAFLVLDEFASMKPEVWELALRPTLADVKGKALFIGTPDGKNHFYDLYCAALEDESGEWEAWQFNSTDNPFIDPHEIETARKTMSSFAFRQEFEASFETAGAGLFKEDWFKVVDKCPFGNSGFTFMAVDPAGFDDISKDAGLKNKRLDETAMAIVQVAQEGWYVKEIVYGRWDVRETSIRILRAAQKHQVSCIGIEGGSLKNALLPYMEDQMRRLNVYPRIESVTHGKQNKTERILWALQGRMEHGRVHFQRGDWNKKFISQMLDFPNPKTHDDLLDALAYIDQVQTADWSASFEIEDEHEPLDKMAGY